MLLSGCTTLASLQQRVAAMSMAGTAIGESDDFIVLAAKGGETAEGLARTHLGDPNKSWMIEDFMGAAPRPRPASGDSEEARGTVGLEANGYQDRADPRLPNIGK